MSVIKRETQSRDSTPPLPPRESALPMPEESLPLAPPCPRVPVPSFVQLPDGGLFAESSVPAGTVFGPYKGSIKRAPLRQSEDGEQTAKSTGLKSGDSPGQAYTYEVDKTGTEQTWWGCIKQTTEHHRANITLFSHNGVLYLRTREKIPEGKELLMNLTTPEDKEDVVEGDGTDDTNHTLNTAHKAVTTPWPHPAHNLVKEGPPFKCNFCCIEFRNPGNLEAHRVYYCPGTATKPLPSSRRRLITTPTQSLAAPDASAVKTTPVQTKKTLDKPVMKKIIATETQKTFVCQLCQSSFESRSNCESHMLLLHCDESANLCKFCNFISGDRKGLCQHVFTHVKGTQLEGTATLPRENRDLCLDSVSKTLGECDEKENRYSAAATATSKCVNRFQSDGTQPASSPGAGHIPSSPRDQGDKSIAKLPSPEMTASLSRDEMRSPPELIKTESPNSINVHSVAVGLNREPAQDDILTCAQCDFATSRESVLLKHLTHHNHLQRKMQDRNADTQVPKINTPDHADTTCHQCNIVFMSKKNYTAHKQYYCAGRHADSTSPPARLEWDNKTGKTSLQGNIEDRSVPPDNKDKSITRKTLNGSDKHREPCLLKVVSPRCSPFVVNRTPTDSSPRNDTNHTSSHSSETSPVPLASPNSRSSPDRPGFDRPLRMIHLDGKPQFLPPGAVLPGQQLVLVTPIVIPRGLSTATKLDNNLKIPAVRPSRIEQPLDLSTKPKTPPLSDSSNIDGHKQIVIPPELLSQTTSAQLRERQSNRCEECEISFSKKESLLVHKQFYCASRHVYSPHALARTKLNETSKLRTLSNSRAQSKSPSPNHLAKQSSHSNPRTGYTETRNSQTKADISGHLNSSPAFSNSSTAGSNGVTSSKNTDPTTSMHAGMILINGNSTHERPDSAKMHNPSPSWCRTQTPKRSASAERSEWDRERSLPPIKRKKNLILDETFRQLTTVTKSNGHLTNGVIVKQEPKSIDSVTTSEGYSKGKSKTVANSEPKQQLSQKASRTSTPSPAPHKKSKSITPKPITVKQEPLDDIPTSNGYCRESHDIIPKSCPSSALFQHQESTSHPASIPDFSPRLPQVRHPITTPTPLTIPIFRHSTPRQGSPSRHMTVSSYLNTGTSRPLFRGVRPTIKHCRNCNISFSSLSTFIAHKKYYCASHHQTKNAATSP